MKPVANRRYRVPHKVIPLLRDPGYANILRIVGQALEILGVEEFDVRILDDNYFVSAHLAHRRLGSLMRRHAWIMGATRYRGEDNRAGAIEFCFTPSEISRLAREFTRRRGNPTRSSDDFGVAELLRVVGHYLELKRVPLLGIFRRDQFLSLRYRSDQSNYRQEYFQCSFFYGLFVKMYLRRADRIPSTLTSPEP
ncbi:MAG TPA: hypothetical protein VNL14_11585 [Candidatus Acidoferrales bacterium]|nr:hypothetical protein [Candidatus Acidoferrales bacterium]